MSILGEPYAYHCVGKGESWAEDKIVLPDPEYIRYMQESPYWTVEPLYKVDEKKLEDAYAQTVIDWLWYKIKYLMGQAEHWNSKKQSGAVRHRIQRSDSYYQVLVLFQNHFSQKVNVFKRMREEIELEAKMKESRKEIREGKYPPDLELYPIKRFWKLVQLNDKMYIKEDPRDIHLNRLDREGEMLIDASFMSKDDALKLVAEHNRIIKSYQY